MFKKKEVEEENERLELMFLVDQTNVRNKKKKIEKSRDIFTFKAIGEVIQDAVDGFFEHRFTKMPFCRLTKIQCEKILYETVNNNIQTLKIFMADNILDVF